MIEKIRRWARALKREIAVLASAIQDPRTPVAAKLLGLAVVAYAVSPIDLIPDFIPVLGFLDDAILLPAGIWLVRRMISPEVMAEHRDKVNAEARLPASQTAAVIVIGIWILGLALAAHWLWARQGRPWIY